jgi:hypothetical protein
MTRSRDLASASIVPAAVSVTELGYIDGVTSAIQTQMDTKAATTGNATQAGTETLTNKTIDASTNTLTGVATLTGTQTLTNKTLTTPKETATISATVATGALNFDAITQAINIYTSNASANWTLNVRGSASVTLNNSMITGETITVVLEVPQGGTAYYQTAITVDGGAITPKWQGGTAPTSGNINSADIYSFTIRKTANATFTVLASQTKFA